MTLSLAKQDIGKEYTLVRIIQEQAQLRFKGIPPPRVILGLIYAEQTNIVIFHSKKSVQQSQFNNNWEFANFDQLNLHVII